VHNNYYFLSALSEQLRPLLGGTVISECFSQHKDELMIRFETNDQPFFIKASLQPSFCCLSFPNDFNRARKNSVDLFPEIIGQRVQQVVMYHNERSFSLTLSDHGSLLFKMHGNRSNVVLFAQDQVVALFRNHQVADADIRLTELHRTIDWSYEAFEKNVQHPEALYFTFGKPVWQYLRQHHFDQKTTREKWDAIQEVVRSLQQPTYYITENDAGLQLSLLPVNVVQKTFREPLAAVNEFYQQYTHASTFLRERQALIQRLQTKLRGGQSYLAKALDKKKEIENDHHYRVWADLLMANLHQVQAGSESITLPDFYQENKPVTIRLRKELSAQKNAEVFYRKAKNQQIEIDKLMEGIAIKQGELARYSEQLTALEKIEDLKTLRSFATTSGLKHEQQKQAISLPYHEHTFLGFRIWVGKSAHDNDEMIRVYAYKEDLWLHAKDVAGSHVIVKHQSGKPFPKPVIERAAQLAAYYSKRKTETLCPVIFTPRKFVRKRKGDPPGAVMVEREEVVMVEPSA
jgi:predicted ribosome quality control (RQC) complex YloA/Tae2 family protein